MLTNYITEICYMSVVSNNHNVDLPETIYKSIIDASPDAIITIDAKGIIIKINPVTTSMFEYSSSELIGKKINMLMPPPHSDMHDSYIRNFYAREDHKAICPRKLIALKKSGTTFPIQITIFESSDTTITGVVKDLSLMNETEKAAVQDLEEKNMFATNISHELRSPLNSIFNMNYLMGRDIEKLRGVIDPNVLDDIIDSNDIIRRNCQLLHTQINDILDYTKLDSNKLVIRQNPFSITDVVDQCRDIHAAAASERGLQLITSVDADVPDNLIGDSDRILQVLVNMISNAIKFTDKGGKVILRVSKESVRIRRSPHFDSNSSSTSSTSSSTSSRPSSASSNTSKSSSKSSSRPSSTSSNTTKSTSQPSSRRSSVTYVPPKPVKPECVLQFTISDTGIGISPDDKEKLFHLFTQLNTDVKRKSGGTGLGLVITKKLCNLMGGDAVLLSSDLGCGSTFLCSCKVKVSPIQYGLMSAIDPHQTHMNALSILKGKKVLIVDNDENNIMTFSQYALEWEMQPTTATSGRSALVFIKGQMEFDIALIDYCMPNMNGSDLAHRMRKMGAKYPFVALTSDSNFTDAIFESIINKPVKKSKLMRVICKLITDSNASTPKSQESGDYFISESFSDALSEDEADSDTSRSNSTSSSNSSDSGSRKASRVTSLRFIIAEDNLDHQKVLQRLLKSQDYTQVTVTADGEEAFEKIKTNVYDIALIDINMPKLSGLELIKKVKSLGLKNPPIMIAVTAVSTYGERSYYVDEAGFDDYISKPIYAPTLFKLITEHARLVESRSLDTSQ